MQKKIVALVSGFWGQNIGNAFFNIGGKKVLESVFPADYKVQFIQDQPGYRTPGYKIYKKQANPKNDLLLLKHIKVDYLVLQGPMLTVSFRTLWEDTFRELYKRGTKIILLSAALFRHTEEEIEINRKFLRSYPPLIICTRDHSSYEAFKDCAEFAYSGIDTAFFVPETYDPIPLDLEPYVVMNFDRFPEPFVVIDEQKKWKPDVQFSALGHHWQLKFPKFQTFFSRQGKWQAYIGALVDFRSLPTQVGEFNIIRTEHRFMPFVEWKVYRNKNVVISDEPFTYFTIYGRTALTLSDRVHACVVTLAYGKPAMLFSPSPRAEIFDRLGLSDIRKRPVILSREKLEYEKKAMLDFLQKSIEKSL